MMTFLSRTILLVSLFWIIGFSISAQTILGFSATYDDSKVEWSLLSTDEIEDGLLEQVWPSKLDSFEWKYRIGERAGTITALIKGDPNAWTLRSSDGKILTLRSDWNGDNTQWSITDNSLTIKFSATNPRIKDEWKMTANKKIEGSFEMITLVEGDPRDWEVVDKSAGLDFHFKIAMVFLAMFSSYSH